MSTAGLELSRFINPNLTWKTVSKGRTTSRRRPALKNSKMGHEQNKNSKRVESQVSDSAKVSGIARRFGDSMEHIPIKKRRFFFRTPSPQPQSPCDESVELEKSSPVPDQLTVPNKMENNPSYVHSMENGSSSGGIKLKTTDDICGSCDDFSGIEILAAVACIDMFDKPSDNTLSAYDESSTKEQINSPREHITDGSLPASLGVAFQTTEQTNTSPASRDDRLHWDLNAPMDEWDRPLDDTNQTIADSDMKMPTPTVDFLVKKTEEANACTKKEPTFQPNIGGPNDVTPSVSLKVLAQKGNFHSGDSVVIGEALSELTRTASNISQSEVADRVRAFKQQCISPSASMEDHSVPSDISLSYMVDRVETVDHCLRLGSNNNKTSLSLLLGNSMVSISDEKNVAEKGSTSTMQVDNMEKSAMDLMAKPVPLEVNCDVDISPCEVAMKSINTMKYHDIKSELPEHSFQSLQHCSMPHEKQELALPTVEAFVNETPDKGLSNIPHFKVSTEPTENSKCVELKTELIMAMDHPSDAHPLAAKNCDVNSMQTSDLEKEPSSTHISSYGIFVAPVKKNELGCTAFDLGDSAQPFDQFSPVGSVSATIDLKHADNSCYSSKSEGGGASTSNMGTSANVACGVETKNEPEMVVYQPQIGMKTESIVKADTAPLSQLEMVPYENSSHHAPRLQVNNEECSRAVSTGLVGECDPYLEDGELRDHHWMDTDGKNRKSEHADCDFGYGEDHKFTETDDGSFAEKVAAVVSENEGNCLNEHLRRDDLFPSVEKKIEEDHSCPRHKSFLAGDDPVENFLKANPSTSNTISMNQLSAMDNPEVVDMDLDDGRKLSIISDDHKGDQNGCYKDIGDVYTEGAAMKDSRRELHYQMEGPYTSYRRGTHFTPRSRYRNFNNSYYRDERQTGVDESLGRGRSSHPQCRGRLGSHYWNRGSRNIVSDPCIEGSDDKFVGPSDDESLGGHQQGMFPGSRGGYSHPARKGSPPGRAEEYDMSSAKGRNANSENGQRPRYDRHPPGLSRGPREGFRGPIYETPNSSTSMSNHFIKGEQSFSPGSSRIDANPPRNRRRSRSRSRTHSPDLRPDDRMGRMRAPYQNGEYFRERRAPFRTFAQGSRFEPTSGRLRSENCVRPGGRPVRFPDEPPSGRPHEYENDDCKRKTYVPRTFRRSRSKSRSCSPEFRNEPRMGRMRLPYAENGHTREHMTDRRSPPRIFNSGKRFDTVGSPSPNRQRSGEYMRTIVRPMRFQDNAQPSREGNEYEGEDYRRKPRTIFDRIRPTRNYEMEGGDGRRFEYNGDDGNPNPNQNFHRGGGDAYARSGDRRPAEVVRAAAREETSNPRNNSDRIYPTGPKPFGNREYSDDTLPRRIRPE